MNEFLLLYHTSPVEAIMTPVTLFCVITLVLFILLDSITNPKIGPRVFNVLGGLVFSVCLTMMYSFHHYNQFSKMSEEVFNQNVVAFAPAFKGQADCQPDSLHVKGTYILQDYKVDSDRIKIAVSLDSKLPRLSYACNNGLYLKSAEDFDDEVMWEAVNAVHTAERQLTEKLKEQKLKSNTPLPMLSLRFVPLSGEEVTAPTIATVPVKSAAAATISAVKVAATPPAAAPSKQAAITQKKVETYISGQ